MKHKIEFSNGRVAHIDRMNPYELNEVAGRYGSSIEKVNGEYVNKAEHGIKTGYVSTMEGFEHPLHIYSVFDSWNSKKRGKNGVTNYIGYNRKITPLEYNEPNKYTANFAPLNWVDKKGRRYFETFSEYYDSDEQGDGSGYSRSYFFFPKTIFSPSEAEKLIRAKHPSYHGFTLDKHPDLYKYGSMVPDNYEWVELENLYPNFESDEKLWEIWNKDQKMHFLKDHFQVEMSKAKNQSELQKFWMQLYGTSNLSYDQLPELVKMELKDHKNAGQYKTGGMFDIGNIHKKVLIDLERKKLEKENDKLGELIRSLPDESEERKKYIEQRTINNNKITELIDKYWNKAKHGTMINNPDQTDMFSAMVDETPDVKTETATKYRADVGATGESNWSNNAMEYDTMDEAQNWLRGLAGRWFGYDVSRVVPATTPYHQPIDMNDPTIFQNYRKSSYKTGGGIGKKNTNDVVIKELVKDLDNTPYSVGLALLRERWLNDAQVYLKDLTKNPKKYSNPFFGSGMYKDLFERIIKHLEFDKGNGTNDKAVKKLVKDLDNTPHSIGLALLREMALEWAEMELKDLTKNPKKWGNPFYSTGMYKDLFQRIIKFLSFSKAEHGAKTGETNKQMVLNSNHMIEHHTEELEKALANMEDVPAWVVAKAFRSATDISDITHYLDGEGKKAEKGIKTEQDLVHKIYLVSETISGEGYSDPTFDIYSSYAEAKNMVQSQLKNYEANGYVLDEQGKDDYNLQEPDNDDTDYIRLRIFEVPGGANRTLIEYSEPNEVVLTTFPSFKEAQAEMKKRAKKEKWDDKEEVAENTESDRTGGHAMDGYVWFQIIGENNEVRKAKKGTKTGSKGFMVFNYTDNIYASNDTFPTKAKANEFIKNFRKRFEAQGYYRDNRMNKVPIAQIDLLAIPSDFSPFRK